MMIELKHAEEADIYAYNHVMKEILQKQEV